MKFVVGLTLIAALVFTATARADDSAPSRFRGKTQAVHRSEKTYTSAPVPAEVDVQLSYAQSSDVWATVHDIRSAQGNLPALNDVLKRSYGVPQEAFTNILAGLSMPLSRGSNQRIHFSVAAEAMGFGLVQNPVVPELHMNAEVLGVVRGGYSFSWDQPGIDIGFAFVGGMGREKRVDATSTDLIESIPLRSGAITMVGFDFDVAHRFAFDRATSLNATGSVKETLFETTTPQAASEALSGQSQSMLTHRWKGMFALERSTELSFFYRSSIALEGIAGPQPLPINVLPRIWDYAHNLYPTPELGAMFGSGLGFTGKLSRQTSLEAHAGYYGGYWGAILAANFGWIKLSAASLGIEDSAAYHVLGERIWQASLGFAI